jgi:hypothetical protein
MQGLHAQGSGAYMGKSHMLHDQMLQRGKQMQKTTFGQNDWFVQLFLFLKCAF